VTEYDGAEPGGIADTADPDPTDVPRSAAEAAPTGGVEQLRAEVDALRSEVAVLRQELAELRHGLGD
jgi:uncharacterized protein YceH (UPF0502 family)